jgi:RNA polymerase sigma factor (sigma-70 family)
MCKDCSARLDLRSASSQELAEIYALVAEAAFRSARRTGLNVQDAEDAAQQAVFAVWKRATPPDCLVAFGRQVARNYSKWLLRRRRHKVGGAGSLVTVVVDLPSEESSDPLRRLDIRVVIRHAEHDLDERVVAVLEFLLEGYTQKQAGLSVGLNRQAVQRLLCHALPILRNHAEHMIDEIV